MKVQLGFKLCIEEFHRDHINFANYCDWLLNSRSFVHKNCITLLFIILVISEGNWI